MDSTRFGRFAYRRPCSSSFGSLCVLRGDIDTGNVFATGSKVCHSLRFLNRELQEERGRGGCANGACGSQAVGTHQTRVRLGDSALFGN